MAVLSILLFVVRTWNQISGTGSSIHSYDERKDLDRLSDLPDDLLVNILSKLKAKQLAQTCVLSKRWHKLWTVVPSLDLDSLEFSDLNRFENFVSTFLSGRDDRVNIDTFNLNCLCCRDDPIIESSRSWILYAVKHYPKNLRMVIYGSSEDHNSHNEIFVCGSLEEMMVKNLGLNFFAKHNFPDIISLPKLRKLCLTGADFDADRLEKFQSGCPKLESVNLKECFMKVTDISFRTVKRLSISDLYDWSFFGTSTVVISAPCLEYLNLDNIFEGLILKDVRKVTKAKICICNTIRYHSEILSSLSGVEDLHLEDISLKEMLQGELPRCPKFHKLKKLTLGGGCIYCDFGLWSSFLKNCPNLEQLIFLHTETRQSCDEVVLSNGHTEKEMIWKLEQVKMVGCHRLNLVNVVNYTRKKFGLPLQSLLEIRGAKIIFTYRE